ncbi:MAG TPA: SDR family oxidoreductase, partial [Turneriella sp.]|nr:SDR family oxidoreductase [Turneriella sp.]
MQKPLALITGASTGIGYEMAKILATKGFDLVVVARNAKKLKALHDELAGQAKVTPLALDLSQPKAAQALYQKTSKAKLKIDLLINNAGYGSSGAFVSLDLKKELGQIDLNIRALTELCHLYGADMAKRKSGKILNVASTAAFQPGPWMSVYYATKSYVLHFSEGIAEELKKSGVQVSVLCPGPTVTEFADTAGMDKSLLFSSKLMKPATANYVAQYGVEKLLKGKLIIIPGFMNRAMAFGNRFSPRFLVRKIAGYLNGGGEPP